MLIHGDGGNQVSMEHSQKVSSCEWYLLPQLEFSDLEEVCISGMRSCYMKRLANR
jgi:hypothetical protein